MLPDTVGLLEDIRDAIRFIAEDTERATLASFTANRRRHQLVERNLITIGEAVNRLNRRDPEVARRISEIPRIIGMRNLLIHAYETINYRTIWRIVNESLPVLLLEVESLLGEATDTE